MSQPQPPPPPPPSLDDVPMITAASWREFFDLTTLSSPASCSEALTRLDQNFHHFRYNYGILAFMIIPLLILFHNLSIVTLLFIAALLSLLYLYFSRRCAASPLRVFSYGIDDRSVFWSLYIATMSAMVIFHNSGRDVLVFIPVYLLMVCLHGALTVPRLWDDLDPYLRLLGADTDSSREPTYNTMV